MLTSQQTAAAGAFGRGIAMCYGHNLADVACAIFGLSYVGRTGNAPGDNLGRAVVITANDGGAAWTPDEGTTWFALPGVSGFWAVAFASPKAGWLVGTDGRILKITF